MGVFAGGFDLEAAEAVSDPDGVSQENPAGSADILEALGSLVDGSLVRQEESDGEPRFSMLETIKEYALERLRETPDWREAHRRIVAVGRPSKVKHPTPAHVAFEIREPRL